MFGKNQEETMCQTTEENFYNFIKEQGLKEIQGEYHHSSYYINEEQERVAYTESSSWGAPTVYMIKCDNSVNSETLSFVGELIKNKFRRK